MSTGSDYSHRIRHTTTIETLPHRSWTTPACKQSRACCIVLLNGYRLSYLQNTTVTLCSALTFTIWSYLPYIKYM